MPKHLYFNPSNFDELVLSGVLIQLFKSDVEVHSHSQGQTLRFVQGENIVESNIENILRFANTISKHKIFGNNWQQEAVINMINSVCKDIEKKLFDSVESSQITDKIQYLNSFWFNQSNQWLKKRFYSCHMNLLVLSFAIQEKFPEILTKYQCFVELRRLFIEEKLLSKTSLIAMFTHPQNKYQEFDLFPELESSMHEVRRSMGSTYCQDIDDQNTGMITSYVQVTAQDMDANELTEKMVTQVTTEQQSQVYKTQEQVSQQQKMNIQTHETGNQFHKDHHPTTHEREQNKTEMYPYENEEKSHTPLAQVEEHEIKEYPKQVVVSQIQTVESAVVNDLVSDIDSAQQKAIINSQHQEEKQQQTNQHHHEKQNSEDKNKQQQKTVHSQLSHVNKEEKQEKTQNLSHIHEQQKKSEARQQSHQKVHTKVQQSNENHHPLKSSASNAVPIPENNQSEQVSNLKANATFEIKLQASIQEVQKKIHEQKIQKVDIEKQKEVKKVQNDNKQQPLPVHKVQQKKVQNFELQKNKAPQSQSQNASVRGPKSNMEGNKIKPKQKTQPVSKQSCKCQIF